MDHSSWSAYSQHLSRLGASMNPSSGTLSHSAAQLNDLALSSAIPRQDPLGSYGNAASPHHFLLAASHGLNPSQTANRSDHSFGTSGLFVANYDASLLSSSFQPSNKGHISTFPQGSGFFKAVGRDNDFSDLRTGFSHCGMPPYGRNPEGPVSHSGAPSLGSNALFQNSMPSGSWRPPGIIPPSCGPFGILPHETVLQRSHLVRRSSGEKQHSSKGSRSSHHGAALMEQDLSRSYRGILSSPARPPSSFMEHGNPNHSSILSPQNDPYFSSVTDSYYNSCSKSDFAAYSSYCSNMQSTVPRGAISPYCYPQSFGSVDSSEKQQDFSSTPNSVNSNFSNVPNASFNPTHPQNGFVSRQTVITSNTNSSTPVTQNSPQVADGNPRHPYPSQRESYNCSSTSSSSSMSVHSMSNRHNSSSQHSYTGQTHYPPMSTPIPAATPAHPTPPSTMGQAHVPSLLAINHDSGCSSVVYNSPSNDGCYSSGTCHSGSASPSKHDISQHSSPSLYSMDNSNLSSMNSSPFVDPNRIHQRTCIENNQGTSLINVATSDMQNSTNDSTKAVVNNISIESNLVPPAHTSRAKDVEVPQVMPPKLNKLDTFNAEQGSSSFENDAANSSSHMSSYDSKCENVIPPQQPDFSSDKKDQHFKFSNDSTVPSALDYTHKGKHKFKGIKRKEPTSTECNYLPEKEGASSPSSSEEASKEAEKSVPAKSAEDLIDASIESDLRNDTSLPVDLSHVSLKTPSKKQKLSADKPEPISAKCDNELNYGQSLLSSTNWSLSSSGNGISQIPEKDQQQNPDMVVSMDSNSEQGKTNEQMCPGSSMDDMSEESKNKLVNNIEEDLGFLAELSATSDGDDTASKESFSGKKRKKHREIFQSFMKFFENSNEPTPSEGNGNDQGTEKENGLEKSTTPELPVLKHKDETESHWMLSSELKKHCEETVGKNDDNKLSSINIHEDKDNFDEAPSLDSGLFNCNTLQKEMVVPNPEAPSFSSDEDENSTQGISDSVAMAIQRLDDEDNNKEKGESSGISKSSDVKNSMAPKSIDEDSNNTLIDEVEQLSDIPKKTVQTSVPPLIVKQKKGRRKKGRHLLVIKVNRIKKQNPVDATSAKIIKKPKKKLVPSSDHKVGNHDGPTDNNTGRRSLMRKCKQKRFQRNCETKKKRKTRSVVKQKLSLEKENQETKTSLVLEEGDRVILPKTLDIIKVPKEMNPTVKISIISTLPHPENIPNKLKKVSKRQKKRRHRPHRKLSAHDSSSCESKDKNPSETNLASNTVIHNESSMSKLPESTNSDANSQNTEVHFKTGDYVTSADSKDADNLPIWRIEGKNVLQLFEVFEEKDGAVLYHNTASYSRWSPSLKHKYSKLNVNVVKCDDESVIIEMPGKTEKSENKEPFGHFSLDSYVTHPQRENFEVYLQTLVSHALDPDFIPEIVKENDEYFLSHLQAIEKVMSEKKKHLLSGLTLDDQFRSSTETFPHMSVSKSKEEENKSCRLCHCTNSQYVVHFHGQLYDMVTLEHTKESKGHSVCDWQYSLCSSCVQTVTLYSRLHHHKYHLYQLGCKRVKDVVKDDKDSHAILEDCLQDAKWMSQMFQDMLDLWNSCDKFR